MRITVCEIGEIDLPQEMKRAIDRFVTAELAACRQREGDIVANRLPGQKLIKLLKDKNAIGSGRMDGGAIKQDPAFDRLNIAPDRFQDGGFSATGRSENNETVRAQNV